ncbi:MAG: hypothetical protein NTY61_01555 [Candidatus Parcubacteria bacterium]|nr:hypothetical protein [Candidatus Parcubacteria bacterium]
MLTVNQKYAIILRITKKHISPLGEEGYLMKTVIFALFALFLAVSVAMADDLVHLQLPVADINANGKIAEAMVGFGGSVRLRSFEPYASAQLGASQYGKFTNFAAAWQFGIDFPVSSQIRIGPFVGATGAMEGKLKRGGFYLWDAGVQTSYNFGNKIVRLHVGVGQSEDRGNSSFDFLAGVGFSYDLVPNPL